MTEKAEKTKGIGKQTLITIGGSLLAQIIFMLLDGTGWEPKVRDTDFINRILNAKLFTEYFHFYDYPFFNFATFLCLISVILCVFADIWSFIFKKSK
ncbi:MULTISPECIES: YfzA family protein [Oceanobacillus]|uniref:YfzA family protein n=1 Tax=Oceanobacillus TaxID=182709 RepID=UPI0021165B34|nr:YfzA family protein [Oceanobacillus oncorhynchi]UUI40793.1 YfzA family protein [Oceanobacillus oncorhynchi]